MNIKFLLISFALLVALTAAQDILRQNLVPNPTGLVAGDRMGSPLAVYADDMIIGAPSSAAGGTGRGKAFIALMTGGVVGTPTLLVPNSTLANGDAFGSAVAVAGDYAVACAAGVDLPSNADAGACWAFGRNIGGTSKWGVIDPLVPTAALVLNDAFGSVASMSTSYVAVGSTAPGSSAGRVWIFGVNKNGAGKFGAITVKNGAAAGDLFGSSVSVSGTYIAVGTGKANSGSVTIYEASQGGTEAFGVVKTVVSPVPMTNENFGKACHLNIPYLVVGSPFSSATGGTTANAWLFSQNNGGSNQFGNVSMLATSFITRTNSAGYASTVAVTASGVAFVGAPANDAPATDAGGVVAFSQGANGLWTAYTRVNQTGAEATSDAFGSSIALSANNWGAIGAPSSGTTGTAGKVVYYTIVTPTSPANVLSSVFSALF